MDREIQSVDQCTEQQCGCHSTKNHINNIESQSVSIKRRDFVKIVSATSLAAASATLPVMAGPFKSTNDYLASIPIDKKLDPTWVASLTARGKPQIYSEPAALKNIGMPSGGLFAGTVYLGGDGTLWLWDIFNSDREGIDPRTIQYKGKRVHTRSGANYIQPAVPKSSFELGFSIQVDNKKTKPLSFSGFDDITFRGEYPRGIITYRDKELPVTTTLEAFSPFIPLNDADSSLPVTLMRYTVKNTGDKQVTVNLTGSIENPICLETKGTVSAVRKNRVVRQQGFTAVTCCAEPLPKGKPSKRTDILFEDFEKDEYTGWTIVGKAFGKKPIKLKEVPTYQGNLNGKGKQVANSHASAPGKDVAEKDAQIGSLTSSEFTIKRRYVRLLIGGGNHKEKTCFNVLIGGKVVASITGSSNNRMRWANLDLRQHEGKKAQLQILDDVSGAWGNIGVDQILFSDHTIVSTNLEEQRDFGSMTLALLNDISNTDANTATASRNQKNSKKNKLVTDAKCSLNEKLVGQLQHQFKLAAGESKTVTFSISWHFPNFYSRGNGNKLVGREYAARFNSALEVIRYVAKNKSRLIGDTQKWIETWYDSTLPYWFLDRTMINTSILATTTCYRFKDGRFWAWEGIGCCAGTCTHVWHYAQAMGRLFPAVERDQRQRIDFGIALGKNGVIGHRANLNGAIAGAADDGQCGRILGAYREHLTSTDNTFLKHNWKKIKSAIGYLIRKDGNADGVIEGAQHNTLDAAWYGKIAFLASLYIAALRACQAMAVEMKDDAFAKKCNDIAQQGAKNILKLYNGEFFIQEDDPKHLSAIGTSKGCYIDQVFGQSWAHQVGLGRLFDKEKQLTALKALWKYNFVPDVGPFRQKFQLGRWYATAGDAGLLMCSWPKGGQKPGQRKHWQYMYFNECMTGFEWQVASHMVAEGMLTEGLAISRSIHDRYDAKLRNPYNEIECSDHYSRAMASYGVFITASGFKYHGPKGHLGFAPKISAKNFKSAFTAAKGWGTFEQKQTENSQTASVHLAWGELQLKSFAVDVNDLKIENVKITHDHKIIDCELKHQGNRVIVSFKQLLNIKAGESLQFVFS